jgi:hypothetical protein
MSIETANVIHAAANVNADAGAPAFFLNRGFTLLVRNGVGDYTLTLEQSAAFGESVVVVSGIDVANATVLIAGRPSPTTVQVLVLTHAGVAVDGDFSIVVCKVVF